MHDYCYTLERLFYGGWGIKSVNEQVTFSTMGFLFDVWLKICVSREKPTSMFQCQIKLPAL